MGFSSAVAAVLGGVARVRHGSAIHDVGTAYTARLRTTGEGPGWFARAGEHDVLVRLSRGAGLPPPWPDVFGLGLRLAAAAGPQDLLLDSCAGPGPLGRHTVVARADLRRGPLGSLVALTDGADRFHLAAFPQGSGVLRDTTAATGLVVVLAAARPYGRWTTVGSVRCDTVAAEQDVRMSPANTGLGIGLSPGWHRFRVRSYRASRAAASRTR